MKTTRKNNAKLFLMAICLGGLMITSSCSKDSVDAVNCATKGKNCEKFYGEDSYLEDEKIATDSSAAVAKLPVRVETKE